MSNTNPPAFPHIDSGCGRFEEGLTLRDYFAAKALQSLLNHDVYLTKTHVTAERAYGLADAMIKARSAK
jgi:hypothetical protein